MKTFLILLRYEWLKFKYDLSPKVMILFVFLCGLYGIHYGVTETKRQVHHISSLEQILDANINELKNKFADPTPTGDITYYYPFFSTNNPDSWSALSLGQRDIQPLYVKLRILGLYGQLFDSDFINPLKALTGNFDLSFVLIYLLPLLFISLSFNTYTYEKETGILPLLRNQPLSMKTFILSKLSFNLILTFILGSVLLLLGILYSQATVDMRLLYSFLGLTLYVAFWFCVTFLVISLLKSTAFNALTLLGGWILFLIIIPSAINLNFVSNNEASLGFKIATTQRQNTHEGWDQPKEIVINKFLKKYPKWSDKIKPEEGAFKWSWYYANQEAGDIDVKPLVSDFYSQLENKILAFNYISFTSPALILQNLFNTIGNTGLSSYLSFLKNSSRYHQDIKNFLYPKVIDNELFYHKNYADAPTYNYKANLDLQSVPQQIMGIFLWCLVLFFMALILLKKNLKTQLNQ